MRTGELALLFVLLALLFSHCGVPPKESRSVDPRPSVDFAFTIEGKLHRLSELRGRPVFLVLVRISDIATQMYVPNLVSAFERYAGELVFIVLSVEKSEEPLLAPFAEFEGLPFPLGVAEEDVLAGRSALGELPPLPVTVLLDNKGRIADLATGVVTAQQIGEAVKPLFTSYQ